MTVRNGPEPDRLWRRDGSVLRLVVGLSDPEHEGVLLPALEEAGDIAITARCLGADQVLACLASGPVDAVLVSTDLHRLTSGVLADLTRQHVPLVLLTPDPDSARCQSLPVVVLSSQADPGAVRQGLVAAVQGGQRSAPMRSGEPQPPAATTVPAVNDPLTGCSVIAVVSGHGSPGRTTVALNLAAALAADASTVLVDADLAGPSLAAYLDADPTRNLAMLAHANPTTSEDWERTLAQETQPLGVDHPNADLLCGVPKPELTRAVSGEFFERLLIELGRRYRYVVLDIGAEIRGAEVAVHRTALTLASQILLVASADLVGLWHARATLGLLQSQLRLDPARLHLVINRHDRRFHHSRTEIEWALGTPMAALIPYDHQRVQRALLAQRPLVDDRRGPASRALLDLAERIQGERLTLPLEHADVGEPGWRRWLPLLKRGRRDRTNPTPEQNGGLRDDHPVAARSE
ncbi:AAA family ATPase [Nitrolancea hollandica]|uniref:Uncharacterized protein n=1 Tax=Nitrolancea hollandica Lb TaxID=1129897 RepID=I4EL63_9BACT|nr:P-loop NTPase [Nitrolancea hollandica]CCF85425.1 hypothetical protein NITHO_4950008 [Nitrolancea hollandica Lb]